MKEGKISNSLLSNRKPLIKRIRDISTGSVNSEKDERRNDDDKIIDISSIDRIQPGQNTMQFENYRQDFGKSPNKSPKASAVLNVQNMNDEQYLSLSIIYNGDQSLAIMTLSKRDLNLIVHAITKLMQTYKSAKKFVGKDALILRYIWIDVDKDQSNHIRLQELNTLLNRINFFVKKSELSTKYNTFCRKNGLLDKKKKDRGLNFRQCVLFFHMIRRDTWALKPIDRIWSELFGDNRSNGGRRVKINVEMFIKKFLHGKQKEHDTTIETVKALFSNLNKLQIADLASKLEDGEDRYIDKNRFEEYLNSKDNDIFDPLKEEFNPQTMNQPLSHYWISSSHNTYLLGDQLLSQSSVEMYLIALHRGCRCVEIDIWDGPSDPSPIPLVKHG